MSSVSSLLSSFADKAQSAINQTPLAGHIPGTTPSGDRAAAQGGHRSLALESIQHQIRSLGQQYTSTSPIQRIITLEKGVALDFDALARDGKAQSKELYTWGQGEDPDLKDVTDRLAFLNFQLGSLSAALAIKLDAARVPIKALRDAEAALVPKRNMRAGLRNQIGRLEHTQEKGIERRLTELKEQLSRAERNDEKLEKELELLKRKAIRESEQKKWEALGEYTEKLALVARAATPIIGALPTLPPTDTSPYTGAELTATARASLQHALDDYKPGQVNLNLRTGADLSRSDTRSFGESHASELSIPPTAPDPHPGLSVTPPIPEPVGGIAGHSAAPPPLADPSRNAPREIVQPVLSGDAAAAVLQQETGAARPTESPSEGLYSPQNESAGEEKRRLEREERERVQATSSEMSHERGRLETAEEEKRRLEREERERVLAGGASEPGGTVDNDGDELPPYQAFQQ